MKYVPIRRDGGFYPRMSLFDNLVNNFFNDESFEDNQRMMSIDIQEEDDKFIVEANLPGFTKKNIKISVNNNELVIEANREETKEEKKGSYCRCERYKGSYRRTLSLSNQVDKDKIDAKIKDGVLSLMIPKIAPEPAKEITIG